MSKGPFLKYLKTALSGSPYFTIFRLCSTVALFWRHRSKNTQPPTWNTILCNISGTLGWNSPHKPQERTTPAGDFIVGNGGEVLLEGGRWLLSFGSNLVDYNPDHAGGILAYDLDSPRFSSTLVYKNTEKTLKKMSAEVDRNHSCLAFTVGLVFSDCYENSIKPGRFYVLRIEQRGRGPQARLVASTMKSLSCQAIDGMLGDYIMSFFYSGALEILNWRTSSDTRRLKSIMFLDFSPDMCWRDVRLLPENKILTIQANNKISIYEIPEFRWTPYTEVPQINGNFEQPIWSVCLSPHDHSTVQSSEPFCGPFATRLVYTQGIRIYGLVIPHDGRTPALYVLAIVPDLPRFSLTATVCIDKIYSEPEDYGLRPFTLAFSWPTEADLAEPTWTPPILDSFTGTQFAGHHTSISRGEDLVDESSGRVVIGSKYEDQALENLPEAVDGVKWSDIVDWSVVDFFDPQFLPSS